MYANNVFNNLVRSEILAQLSDGVNLMHLINMKDYFNCMRVRAILIRDTRDVTIFSGQAWIQKMPKSTLGQKLRHREWKIRVAKLEAVVG